MTDKSDTKPMPCKTETIEAVDQAVRVLTQHFGTVVVGEIPMGHTVADGTYGVQVFDGEGQAEALLRRALGYVTGKPVTVGGDVPERMHNTPEAEDDG